MIYKEGHSSSYGDCWIEGDGKNYWVHVGSSTYGLYSSLADAEREFNKYC